MAASARDVVMKQYSSSPELSSLPDDSPSEPGSPSRMNAGRAKINMGDEIIVDTATARFGSMHQHAHRQDQPQNSRGQQGGHLQDMISGPPWPEGVKLTKDGVPRKKPGRKPGTTAKKVAADGLTEAPKQKRPRKPKDPNAPPVSRKRKSEGPPDSTAEPEKSRFFPPSTQTKLTELTSMRMDIEPRAASAAPVMAAPKRESKPNSMQSILNDDDPAPSLPSRAYDPVRSSNYDPVRETMISRDPYGTGALGSPRGPSHFTNRASASPSIASLVDPPPTNVMSPPPLLGKPIATQPRIQQSSSLPPSPSNAAKHTPQLVAKHTPQLVAKHVPEPAAKHAPQPAAKSTATEVKRNSTTTPSSTSSTSSTSTAVAAKSSEAPVKVLTGPTSSFKDVTMSGTAQPPAKKVASIVQQERKQAKAASSSTSSPKTTTSLKDVLPPVPDLPSGSGERSILDFGKAKPGEEFVAPDIVLHIPLFGETNKYVNFTRLAEEQYGWDALHPRQAALRDRKARIAAATAALEKTASNDDADEMSVDSADEGSGGAGGGTSGPDGAPAKPARKKRNFKEDEYDRDDDFVDDSEMIWEEQAAASRDGFFVYLGALVPEAKKPEAGSDGPPKRGRGSRGRGSATRGGGTSRGRGGGPGSRGGTVARKPRMTKVEKAQMLEEKLQREKLAQVTAKSGGGNASNASAPLSSAMAIDV